MGESSEDPTRVVGQRPKPSLRHQRILSITVVLYTAFVAWQLSRGRWSSTGAYVVWATWLGVVFLRGPTVVEASGTRRPWRLRGAVAWGDVDRVASPQTGIGRVRLWMKNGKTLNLDDVPVEESAAVAAIGGVLLGSPPQRTVAPPPRPNRPTDRDIEADVNRRAQALAERGKQLDAEYRRLQPRTPAPGSPPPDTTP